MRDSVQNGMGTPTYVSTIKTERDGKLYNIKPKYLAKAQAHWARKAAQRKMAGNCGRSGQPNHDKTHKHCAKCREYGQRYKAGKEGKATLIHDG
jgi:hypothetical protein